MSLISEISSAYNIGRLYAFVVKAMTSPRGEIYDPETVQWFHCYSRCVRRAFLCGWDAFSGHSYEHRREWVSSRLSHLSKVFSIDIAAYAIMGNHLHTVLCTRPDLAKSWSANEVARRWRILFPLRRDAGGRPLPPTDDEIDVIIRQPSLVEQYRLRLSSLSWFHQCLNESIARRANREDECTGRFWEGRFRSELLTSPEAVIACSVYTDLNPIRAGIAPTPEESNYTSIQQRIFERINSNQGSSQYVSLLPVDRLSQGRLSEEEYLTLVDQTGRLIVEGKKSISPALAPILTRVLLKPEGWLSMMREKKRLFRRAIGPEKTIRQLSKKFRKKWFQGLGASKIVFA